LIAVLFLAGEFSTTMHLIFGVGCIAISTTAWQLARSRPELAARFFASACLVVPVADALFALGPSADHSPLYFTCLGVILAIVTLDRNEATAFAIANVVITVLAFFNPAWTATDLFGPLALTALVTVIGLPWLWLREQQERQIIEQHDRLIARQTQQALVDRLISIGTLFAGVGHEINNPLTYITANLEWLLEAPGSPERRAALEEARAGADRISAIVRDLNMMMRPGSRARGVELDSVIAASVNMTRHVTRHRAPVEVILDEMPRVRGDGSRLGQVLTNLIVNAAQALDGRGESANLITIRGRTNEIGWAEVEVADTGPGIPDDVRERIFEPFFTTKGPGDGTGLGLSISKGIVEDLGGSIDVDSEVGKGTTFRLRLPPHLKSDMPIEEQAVPSSGSQRILIVDDDPPVVTSLQRMLEDHDVATARGGAEALEMCEQGDFDLVLCDVRMPDLSGPELYEVLCGRDDRYADRFVFMTGGPTSSEGERIMAQLRGKCLLKPISRVDVERLLPGTSH
jgi:signal transduction histidine kinase